MKVQDQRKIDALLEKNASSPMNGKKNEQVCQNYFTGCDNDDLERLVVYGKI